MIAVSELPSWAAWFTAVCVLGGAMFALTGAIGLVRLPTFFERIHAPTLSTSMGTAGIVLGSIVFFSALTSGLVLHQLLIGIFVTITTPITFMVLARAVLYRERYEDGAEESKKEPK